MAQVGYRVYITDAYEWAGGKKATGGGPPPMEASGERIHVFEVAIEERSVRAEWKRSFGETEGPGVLQEVESLAGDPAYNRLLVADEEMRTEQNIKVYTLDGRFTGTILGDGVFRYQPEGITLYARPDGSGFWICADQGSMENLFHLFDRESLGYLATFSGEVTRNTDGIWLEAAPLTSRYPAGIFFAVRDDGNIAAFDFSDILEIFPATRSGEPDSN